MRLASSESVGDILKASRDAIVAFKTTQISTRRLMKRSDGSGLADMEVTVYDTMRKNPKKFESATRNKKQSTTMYQNSVSFVVSIPHKWKPNLFLAMLHNSIRKFDSVSLERVPIGGGLVFGMNEVHCFFSCALESVEESILRKGGYTGVFGGDTIV